MRRQAAQHPTLLDFEKRIRRPDSPPQYLFVMDMLAEMHGPSVGGGKNRLRLSRDKSTVALSKQCKAWATQAADAGNSMDDAQFVGTRKLLSQEFLYRTRSSDASEFSEFGPKLLRVAHLTKGHCSEGRVFLLEHERSP